VLSIVSSIVFKFLLLTALEDFLDFDIFIGVAAIKTIAIPWTVRPLDGLSMGFLDSKILQKRALSKSSADSRQVRGEATNPMALIVASMRRKNARRAPSAICSGLGLPLARRLSWNSALAFPRNRW